MVFRKYVSFQIEKETQEEDVFVQYYFEYLHFRHSEIISINDKKIAFNSYLSTI